MTETKLRILRSKHVTDRTGLPKSTLYSEVSAGRFPQPVRITQIGKGWVEAEVEQWIEERIHERDSR